MVTITLNSFGFLRSGIPKDSSTHGGGHVFDCRCLPNPGRQDKFKQQSGLDKPVIDYLKTQDVVDRFFEQTALLVSISVDNYLERSFKNLMVSYGCTGGQHRSVYLSEKLKLYLNETYQHNIEIFHTHIEQYYWGTKIT